MAGHTIWSIGVPIAIVEAMTPAPRTTPWTGRAAMAVTGAVFLLGAALIYWDHQVTEQFSAPAWRQLGATALSAALVAAAFAIRRRPRPQADRRAPSPRLACATAFAASSLFILVPATWLGVALDLLLLAAMGLLIARWSRSAD